ncbi:MAG: hypothetical protein AAB907_04205, partial [Patescibacteria group bacterium]
MDGNEQSEKQPIPQQPRPLEQGLISTRLTPFERMVIRSTISVDGVVIGLEQIPDRGPGFYLRPFGLALDATPEEIASFSQDRENRFLVGYLGIFDPDPDLVGEGYEHRLWFSRVDS